MTPKEILIEFKKNNSDYIYEIYKYNFQRIIRTIVFILLLLGFFFMFNFMHNSCPTIDNTFVQVICVLFFGLLIAGFVYSGLLFMADLLLGIDRYKKGYEFIVPNGVLDFFFYLPGYNKRRLNEIDDINIFYTIPSFIVYMWLHIKVFWGYEITYSDLDKVFSHKINYFIYNLKINDNYESRK